MVKRQWIYGRGIYLKGTVDENVLDVLTGKAERQDALIEAVKARVDLYAG